MDSSTHNYEVGIETALLLELIKKQFVLTSIRKWGYFFPILVATLIFIVKVRSNVLGDFTVGYDTQPYFEGEGLEWFVDSLLFSAEYEDLIEPIFYEVVGGITSTIKEREHMLLEEIPQLDVDLIDQLRQFILERLDEQFGKLG